MRGDPSLLTLPEQPGCTEGGSSASRRCRITGSELPLEWLQLSSRVRTSVLSTERVQELHLPLLLLEIHDEARSRSSQSLTMGPDPHDRARSQSSQSLTMGPDPHDGPTASPPRASRWAHSQSSQTLTMSPQPVLPDPHDGARPSRWAHSQSSQSLTMGPRPVLPEPHNGAHSWTSQTIMMGPDPQIGPTAGPPGSRVWRAP